MCPGIRQTRHVTVMETSQSKHSPEVKLERRPCRNKPPFMGHQRYQQTHSRRLTHTTKPHQVPSRLLSYIILYHMLSTLATLTELTCP
jgi:hypothetical protein